ncbi:SDR family oxidoreductase [Longimicrobium sp.]|uniref:SDR family oxidoreductase n=1 Tax=Longimicrobium sp. TaxID=2029185 RepID=UPI002E327D9B|nr:SDR family oxidoreductase [Longimicrobium sp.]HEX6040250.1 SDR family oxidoreductase [Longimicrobium sp.]
MMGRVLVAGATGQLGRQVAGELRRRGWNVRALTRDPARLAALGLPAEAALRGDLRDAASLRPACAGADAVVSCAGASMRLGGLGDRRGFMEVDWAGNRALLDAARAAGVRRFVYVSVFGAERLRGTVYVDAHERFVDALAASGMDYAVVRPTGFFSFMGELVRMAAKGRGAVIGDGGARTNPVHETDVAAACADALAGTERRIDVGGPDTFTRRELAELAFRAVGRAPRIMAVPPGAFRAVAALTRPINPRIAALLEFGTEVSLVDCVAPTRGTRRLEDHFRAVAAEVRR